MLCTYNILMLTISIPQAYSSEKSKLSQHLDSFAAKVTALEQRSTDEQLLSAKLQQTVDHLEKQLQQSKDKVHYIIR